MWLMLLGALVLAHAGSWSVGIEQIINANAATRMEQLMNVSEDFGPIQIKNSIGLPDQPSRTPYRVHGGVGPGT